ncbi:hypothetical protein [Epilithonimonas mollis]|uniref:Uncharacterized protein n=1 Tax=Epilithonimonas mollis TaxID=216903 RepID=A0A1M6UK09_9FLAO|nr:hypothetical protein [Epilithonimonas mollis]SHK69521.1 hypothetical protein SAMN05444371_3340 [Epilithonimonas mollis]
MDYKALVEELQAEKLEQTDDAKVFKVVLRYKKLLMDFGDPFDWRKFEFRNPNHQNDIIELTIKLIDFLNDHFEFLKPLK